MLYSTPVLCFLIPFLVAPTGFYLALVGAALFGETYRHSAAARDALPIAEETRNAGQARTGGTLNAAAALPARR